MTPQALLRRRFAALLLTTFAGMSTAADDGMPQPCDEGASEACYRSFTPATGAGTVHYYASRTPGAATPIAPRSALIVLHGHSRDANRSFDAGLETVRRAQALDDTLVVAPLFQVAATDSARCRTKGVPDAAPGDALWTCGSWPAGAPPRNGGPGSFVVLDALVAELVRQWPSLRRVTLAGFSAGGQVLQHSIGFAADPPPGVTLRYVVADPGSWLYFDAFRPLQAEGDATASCPDVNRWKYGTDALPADLGRTAAEASAHYAAAEIHYLEGALDEGSGKGTAYRVLDRSCAANAQGPYRLQRGMAYAAYDRSMLAPDRNRQLTIVPGCAHDVACVFPSEAAREALMGPVLPR